MFHNKLYKDIENTSDLNSGLEKKVERRNILRNEWKNSHYVPQLFG